MRSSLQPRRSLRLGLAALTLALELVVVAPPTSFAQAAPTAPATTPAPAQTGGPDVQGCGSDYPVSGGPTNGAGWFYTEEACQFPPITGVGPARWRGFTVLDDERGNFWTEFRRFGGVDVLGYPVSQPYHYPVGSREGYWYQAFERGVLQYHPESGRADMANVFEQFTEADPCPPDPSDAACLDNKLLYFGIPKPQQVAGSTDASYGPEQRMGWLTEPRLLARYFYDPVAFHSSEPDRGGNTAFATQEQAWAFFGLPQATAQRMVLRAHEQPSHELWPLVHSFMAQRFQKGGLELFLEDNTESFAMSLMNGVDSGQLFDPTIVPGDGKKGCVAVTAVGLLARSIGIDKVIPRGALLPLPADPHPTAFFTPYIPMTSQGQFTTQFQIDGTGFGAGEPITINLTDGLAPSTGTTQGQPLPPVTLHVDHANSDGSFTQVVTARVGTYTIAAKGDQTGNTYAQAANLSSPTVNLFVNRPTTCKPVGLPVGS
jgi:hypothetical protein